MIKKVGLAAALLLLLLGIWRFDLLAYGYSQAKGQLTIIWNARNIDEVLQDPTVPDSLKLKINLVQEIREFAIYSLGLNDSDSYHTLYDQKGKPVLWVITACEPFSMQDKEWSFPILGSFSYKGFFDYQKALSEKKKLAEQGYDTGIRTVNAWSTLGFLNDPIMSELLFRDEGNVANTIVHELTHGTVFVKNDLKFNESLATFVGHEGAVRFLAHQYGKESPQFIYYQTYMSDRKKYVAHMLKGMSQLDSLYHTFESDMNDNSKLAQKQQFTRHIVQSLDTVAWENAYYKRAVDNLQQKDTLPNNTFFKSFARYEADVADLEKIYRQQYNSNIKIFINYLKETYPSL